MNLSPSDQSMLERYFSEGRMERSPMGSQLDHLELFSVRQHGGGEVTARPTAEVRIQGKAGPDDALIWMLGKVSRRLSVVRRTDPVSYQVLDAWFGDGGARRALLLGGRLMGILRFTEAGKAYLAKARAKERGAARERTDDARMEAAKALATTNEELKRMLGIARAEAVVLVTKACDAWRATEEPRHTHRKTPSHKP